MGTNFYLKPPDDIEDEYLPEAKHVGKRSASGIYCYDCKVTLCKQGEERIHYGNTDWYEKCPKCGKEKTNESLNTGTGGLELGFWDQEQKEKKRTGVMSSCSFSWAMLPSDIPANSFIWDEYGEKYTYKEFMDMLNTLCPIQYYRHLGQAFS